MLKKIFKIIGLILYFVIIQCISTIGIFLYKYNFDINWMNKFDNCINVIDGTINVFSSEYINVISELILPSLIAADIIILIPLLIKGIKNNRTCPFIKRISKKDICIFLDIGIILNFFISVLIDSLPQTSTNQYNSLMNIAISGNFIIVLIATGILTPIIEELVFRYGIISIITSKSNNIANNKKRAIIISSVIFGIAHFNIIQSIYAILFGLLLGYIYVKTQNILASIFIHIGVNSSSVIYEFIPNVYKPIVLCVIFILVYIYSIYYFRKFKVNKLLLENTCTE